jgi:hypothetical protein
LSPNVQGGYHSFEVTPDVQNWANGAPDYGWGVIPWPGGSDGWGIDTAESTSETSRPELVVYYTPGSGVVTAAPTLLPPVVSSTQVQVQVKGTIGATYSVWRAASVNGSWTMVGTAMIGSNGIGTVTDNSPLPNAAFYRASNP